MNLLNEHGDRVRDLDPDPDQCRDCHHPLDDCVCEPEPLSLDKTEATCDWFDTLDQRQAARDAEEAFWAEQKKLQMETDK